MGHRFSFASFYARRARRILPALFAVLLATLAAGGLVLLPSDYEATLRAAAAAVLSGSNLLFWQERASYFGALEERQSPLLHTWSLGVEEQFYLVFPLMLLAWMRLSGRWRGFAGAGQRAGRPLPQRDVLLASLPRLGAVGRGSPGGRRGPCDRFAIRELRLGGLAAIVFSAMAYSDATVFPGLSALLPVLGAAAVIHAGSGGGAPLHARCWPAAPWSTPAWSPIRSTCGTGQ